MLFSVVFSVVSDEFNNTGRDIFCGSSYKSLIFQSKSNMVASDNLQISEHGSFKCK